MSARLVFIVWYKHSRRASTLAAELGGQVSFYYESSFAGRSLASLYYLVQGWKTWQFLEREQPESVIVQVPPIFALLVVAAWCELRGKTSPSGHRVPYSIDCHTGTFYDSRWRWALPLLRLLSGRAVLVTSERERLALKSMLPGSVIEVVPNGVDVETFQEVYPEQEVPGRIIFTGAMTYHTNISAVIFFAQQCWPLIQARIPGATWQIVGRNPPPEVQRLARYPGLTVTGSVPNVRPYLAEASVAIAPLLVSSGTRLKILEALAMRKATVSTDVGCGGYQLSQANTWWLQLNQRHSCRLGYIS